MIKLLFVEIAEDWMDRLLGWDSQNRAAQSGQRWFSPHDVAKKGLNGG
jgi:hypothetical protein